jgi:biopolymer transport protein ExbD
MTRATAPTAEDREDEINLTPLLDVVFIMLIFFIVTATFFRETGLDANHSEAARSQESASEAMLITIDANDDIWVEGRIVDRRAVRAHMVRLHAANPEWPIVVEPNKLSTTKMLVAVLDAARASRIENVTIAGEISD